MGLIGKKKDLGIIFIELNIREWEMYEFYLGNYNSGYDIIRF